MDIFSMEIDKSLNETLAEKNVRHRTRFKQLFKARYMEMLPSLIQYKNFNTVSVDFLKVEVALRNGHDVVIGQTRDNKIMVLGLAKNYQSSENPADIFSQTELKKADIDFIIPTHKRMDHYREITDRDQSLTGNFVVLRNKTLNYISDVNVLDHYIDEMAEIVLSRYSISMQVKVSSLFFGEPNDQSMEKLITKIYNGDRYVPGSKLFDPNDQIYHFDNTGTASVFKELKTEYQNKISELNNMLGINSLAVEKSSGVSDTEANSNRAYTTSNANIYLDARNNGLRRLNKRFNLDIHAMYNDDVVSEFEELSQKEGDSFDNNNPV